MKIFISWSGKRSQKMAEALRDWLPHVFQTLQPWVSSGDIQAGTRWANQLAKALNEIEFGILCITNENMDSPWLIFEAGALSKSVESGRVVPYLFGLTPNELSGPLSSFQAVSADEDGTRKLIQSIRECNPQNFQSGEQTKRAFSVWWPHLEEILNSIDSQPADNASKSTEVMPDFDAAAMIDGFANLVRNAHEPLLKEFEEMLKRHNKLSPGNVLERTDVWLSSKAAEIKDGIERYSRTDSEDIASPFLEQANRKQLRNIQNAKDTLEIFKKTGKQEWSIELADAIRNELSAS